MKLAQVNYDEKLEDTSSQEFRDFGEKLQQEVSVTPEDELYWFDLLCSFTSEFKQLLSLLWRPNLRLIVVKDKYCTTVMHKSHF